MKILIVTTPDMVVHRMGFQGTPSDIAAAIQKIRTDLPESTFEEIDVEAE